MRISDVTARVVRNSASPPSPTDETVIVSISTDSGLTGWGEANARAAAVRSLIHDGSPAEDGWDDGIRAQLVGATLEDPAALYRRLKESTFWSCRAGIGHVAIAGVAMALWDLAGKAEGVPVWRLLGEQRNHTLEAYATIYHGRSTSYQMTLKQTLGGIDQALEAGFGAVKIEALADNTEEEAQIVDLARQAREHIGDEIALLLDVGYYWVSAADAEATVQQLGDLNLFALEAPFPPHLVSEHLRLKEIATMPIATGDQLTCAIEHLPLLDAGAVDYIQAGASRTGLDDMGLLARRASARGLGFMPWGWVSTALSVAANLHACIGHGSIPLIEYGQPSMFPESAIRHELTGPEPELSRGAFVLPSEPGLGIDVDEELLERLTIA